MKPSLYATAISAGLFLLIATGGHSQDQQPPQKPLGIKAIQAAYDDAIAAAAEEFDVAAEKAHADFLLALEDAIQAAEDDGKSRVATRLNEAKASAEADGPPTLTGHDTLKAAIDLSRLSGQWVVRYTNGATRTYLVDKAGNVMYGKLKGKLQAKNGEILIDSLERPLWERWHFCSGQLIIEHFNPKDKKNQKHDESFPLHVGFGLRLQGP